MYFNIPLILFLLAHVAQSDANLLARSSDSIVRAASRAHRHAVKRSAGLARDLRLSFRGILAADTQQPAAIGNSRVYCVNSPAPGLTAGNGTNVSNGNGTSSISFGPVPTSKGSPTGSKTSSQPGSTPTTAPSASSPWSMIQSYVSATRF